LTGSSPPAYGAPVDHLSEFAVILLHYQAAAEPRLAIKDGAEFFDAGVGLLEIFAGSKPEPQGPPINLSKVRLAPCVPKPGKIICVGLNYRRHAAESNLPAPDRPIIFSKLPNALAASGDDIRLPSVASHYDYEAELVVVMGRAAHNVSEGAALDYVWGFCNGNDVSARDLQMQSSQWLLGKTLDRFGPIGPWIVSRDEAGELADMSIRCSVNGEVRQSSRVQDMIFSVPELVSFLSRHFTLDPGDVIFTGTPEGVASGRPDHPWLKPGDEVVVEVGPLGRLVNRMVS
jgi:2-keto-4-pentenoate hydratase/2-oxohepta-3-ene-1,7-dioic acid hydratase in catechol pathway